MQSSEDVAAVPECYIWLKLISDSLQFGISENENGRVLFQVLTLIQIQREMGCCWNSLNVLVV